MTDTREPFHPASHMHTVEDDVATVQAALAVEARIARGEEELIPANVVDPLIDGEPPLRVWREFREQPQAALASASGVNREQIVDIEVGRSMGSVNTLRKLADALSIAADDLIPASPETSERGQ